MNILMVTPYPPVRDGIASYAAQAVKSLRAEGHHVEVLSPGPSAAHHHLDLVGARGALALAKRVTKYDKVIVQFHPDFFYPMPSTPRDRIEVSTSLTATFRLAKEVEIVVHEIDYRHGKRHTPDGLATRLLWHSVDRVVVHTEKERADFSRAFGVSPARISLAPHGASFVPATFHDRPSARATLGIPADAFLFLAIGFVQEHKGFDRAITAFAGLAARNARLDIVGSVRVDEEGNAGYENHVNVMAAGTDGVYRHRGFVSDELFDRWVVAADMLVLPYRSVWSSGVLERARMLGTPVIATKVGSLSEQAGTGADVTFVKDDRELRGAMWAAATGGKAAPAEKPWPSEGADLHTKIQREVRLRAAAARGVRVSTAGATDVESADALRLRGELSAPVRRVGYVGLPAPTSARPGVGFVKRVVKRLTSWEVEPVVGHVNELRGATTEAVEGLAAQIADLSARQTKLEAARSRRRRTTSQGKATGQGRATGQDNASR